MDKLRKTLLVMIGSVALSLQAGPKGYFKTEKGALVKGEVLYADEVFYYYQRVSNPGEIFTVKIKDVPISFRRIADRYRLKGEIGAPPESIVKVEVVEKPYGEWQLTKKLERDPLTWRFAVLTTKDDEGRIVKLVTRYCHGKHDGYRKFDILLDFDYPITNMYRWQVTYQFDDEDPGTELWKGSSSNTALFSPTSFWFRDRLMKSDYVSFAVNNKGGETRRFRFKVSHFDQVYEDLFKPVVHE